MAEEITYKVDTEAEEFKEIEAEKADKLAANEKFYNDMAANTSGVYGAAIDAAKDYAETQSKLQQERTDLTIEQIEQQKEAEEKDYKKEQSGAYADFVKQSGKFGAEAEEMAASGLSSSGFSESSRTSMFNTYQNRVASAREIFKRAMLNYDNMIAEAKLQNSSELAQIAYNALMAETQYAIQELQYNNEILMAKEEQNMAIESMYDDKWESLYDRLYAENALAAETAADDLLRIKDDDPPEQTDTTELIDPEVPETDGVISEDVAAYAEFLDTAVEKGTMTQTEADTRFEEYIEQKEARADAKETAVHHRESFVRGNGTQTDRYVQRRFGK